MPDLWSVKGSWAHLILYILFQGQYDPIHTQLFYWVSFSFLPYAVEDLSIWEDSDVDVGHDDVVEVAGFLVLKESIGHPHLVWVCHG